MSWLSQFLKGAKIISVLAKIREEAPQAVPLLEALEANNYETAAEVVLNYGDVGEIQEVLASEVHDLIAKIVDALPPGTQSVVEALLAEHLSAEVQEKLLAAILAVSLQKADDIIPEETILKALKIAGID